MEEKSAHEMLLSSLQVIAPAAVSPIKENLEDTAPAILHQKQKMSETKYVRAFVDTCRQNFGILDIIIRAYHAMCSLSSTSKSKSNWPAIVEMETVLKVHYGSFKSSSPGICLIAPHGISATYLLFHLVHAEHSLDAVLNMRKRKHQSQEKRREYQRLINVFLSSLQRIASMLSAMSLPPCESGSLALAMPTTHREFLLRFYWLRAHFHIHLRNGENASTYLLQAKEHALSGEKLYIPHCQNADLQCISALKISIMEAALRGDKLVARARALYEGGHFLDAWVLLITRYTSEEEKPKVEDLIRDESMVPKGGKSVLAVMSDCALRVGMMQKFSKFVFACLAQFLEQPLKGTFALKLLSGVQEFHSHDMPVRQTLCTILASSLVEHLAPNLFCHRTGCNGTKQPGDIPSSAFVFQ